MSSRRTLVVAPNWVGDTVMALPVLEALHGSGRELHVLAKSHLHSLLDLVPAVAGSITRGSDSETIARIREIDCGEAFILPNSFRSAWLPYRAKVPRRYGYRGNLRSLLLQPGVSAPRELGHQVADYGELLAAAGVDSPADWTPKLVADGAAKARADDALERAGVKPNTPIIGIFPGAEFGPSKRWPWQSFGDLTHALRKARPKAQLILLAGPKEVWSTVRIHERSGHLVPVLGADLDLAELAGLLSKLELLVTNDSGPMHIAAAVGVPCVSIFGPTNPKRTSPYGPGHQVLYTNRWCSPCFKKRCPLIHNRCMKDITVDQVVEAAVESSPVRLNRSVEEA